MFTETPAGFAMHRVVTREDWSRVRALRNEMLESSISGADERVQADPHDLALNGSTFLLTRNARAVATTRSSVSTPHRRWTLPAMDIYTREIRSALGLDATVVEASLTATDPETSTDTRVVLLHLMKAHMLQCATQNADWMITAVREAEIGFYRRMLDMEILSGAEPWPGMRAPRVLMGLRYREHAHRLAKRFPMLEVTLADEAEYAASAAVAFPRRVMSQQAA